MSSILHCASCGRLDKQGPDGADPILSMGILWCSKCAVIEKIDGTKYVIQPSPGRMVGDPKDDPLTAWQDCYSIQPKKRILIKDARSEIQRAWRVWEGEKTTENSMFIFFGWLSRHRPYFLTFRLKGDPWQRIHGWLIRYERAQQDINRN